MARKTACLSSSLGRAVEPSRRVWRQSDRGGGMRFVSCSLRGLAIMLFVVSAAAAFQLAQPQAEPKIAIRCGPVRGVILKQVTPTYPAEARAKGVQGMVRVSVLVDKNGVPDKLRVLSGPPELVNASLDALKQWRYKSYKLNGK